MNIHEHQAKESLRPYGLPIVPYFVVSHLDEIPSAVDALEARENRQPSESRTGGVVKVQVHAGGRGKAGGVVVAKSRDALIEAAKKLLGMHIINNQTGKEGVVAREILISPLIDFVKEAYLGVIVDRKKACVTLIASPEGGVEIEEVAAVTPEKIRAFPAENNGKIRSYHLIELAKFMGWQGKTADQGKEIAQNLVKAFFETDATLLEINPLVETAEGDLFLLDAKLSLDETALFRHPNLAQYFDPRQLPATEARAKSLDLAYVALDGSIGCMVNGAGLAMATMDIIQYFGGTPANFLDVGGSASEEKIAEGFKIILADPNVKAIFVNIFGGIMNCKTLASGILSAAKEQKFTLPLIVRMEGTNVEEGRALLASSGLAIIVADGLADGAEKAVKAAHDYGLGG